MVAPAIVAGGLMAGQVLSGMLNKSSTPSYNSRFAIDLAKQGENKENNLTGDYVAGANKNIGTLRTDINAAKASADEQSRGAAQDYLSNYDPITSRLVQSRTDQLKQQLFGQIPELTQAAREAGAAGGGLDRGVTQNALANIPIEQGKQFATGATNLANTALQGQLDARSKVYDSQNQLILNKLGIDNQTAEAILNSGNEALVNELNQLIDTSRNSIGLQINADAAAQGASAGIAANNQANRQAVNNGLLNVGATLLGNMGGGNTSAPVTGVTNNRTVISSGLNDASAGLRA